MARVLVDFHHSSLLRSLVLLFEGRLGMEIRRPIGMEWFTEGFWAINDQEDTARQFLDFDSQPLDNTPPLNDAIKNLGDAGAYNVSDPGSDSFHGACTLGYFKNHQFDYVVASIPEHIEPFRKLIREYQPNAKLILQVGNNWDFDQYGGINILASIAPRETRANALFYHQEFDLQIFYQNPVEPTPTRKVYSFVNIIQNTGQGWDDYQALKTILEPQGWDFKAFGGQCPDGNMTGPYKLAEKMREAAFIYHVKPGGDGFGHIIHNAYAVGRPIITRKSMYIGQLAEQLMVPGTYIDMDQFSIGDVKNQLTRLIHIPETLQAMGAKAAERFREVVDYESEARKVGEWLEKLV